jgi:uncharacterized membrane protein YdjX (TVP38/TMEM64 family)
MAIKVFIDKIVAYVKELGRITPLAFLTAAMPAVGGTIFLMVFAYSLGYWLRDHWQTGAPLFLLGVIVFCGLGLLATNILGIISGYAFGFELGILVMMTGIVCAATVAYFINSKIVGDKLPHVFENHPKAQAVYQALIGQSLWRTTLVIFLLRLSPAMPFALTNFLMSSARVPLKSFVPGTFFGMLPRSSAVVLVGSQLSELSFNDPQEAWLIVFGIIATIISIIFISVVAKRALERLTRRNAAV